MVFLADIVLTLLITVSILLLSYYLCIIWQARISAEVQPIFVIHVTKALGKLCPVNIHTRWKLLSLDTGTPRCWQQKSPISFWGWTPQLYGCSIIVKAPTLSVLRMICNTSNWGEWNPDSLSKSFAIQHFDNQELKRDDYMRCTKIVSAENRLEFYRFSHLSTINLGWVLFWNASKIELSFFFVQPLRKNEHDECLLTCISVPEASTTPGTIAKKLTFIVNSIRDAIEIQTANVFPFHVLSDNKAVKGCPKSAARALNSSPRLIDKACRRKNSKQGIKVFKLLPYFTAKRLLGRQIKGFDLVIENVQGKDIQKEISICSERETAQTCVPRVEFASQEKVKNESVKPKFALSTSCDNISVLKKEDVDIGPLAPGLPHRTQTVSALGRGENNVQAPLRQRWFSESNLNLKRKSIVKSSNLLENLPEEDSSEKLDANKASIVDESSSLENTKNIDGSGQNISDFEILLPQPEMSDYRVADLFTKGNYSASQLQTEVLEASSLSLQSSIEDQSTSAGGWSFHSYYKGITVLSKVSFSGMFKTISYICQIEIPMKSEEVWKVIKNPRLRFICDETVKKVQILEEISDDQKIIHLYHEMNNFLKRESIDFCVLHTERRENSKYYLALFSFEYVNCPLMSSTIRGTLLPSGWVVEPVPSNNANTKVTYLYQVMVNNPNSHFVQDLSSLLPISVFNMKNYVMLTRTCPVP